MGSLPFHLLLLLLAVLIINHGAQAEIRKSWITQDSRSFIEFLEFGFSQNGSLDARISNTSMSYSSGGKDKEYQEIDPSNIKFFLLTESQWESGGASGSKLAFCSSSSEYKPGFTFQGVKKFGVSEFNLSVSYGNKYEFMLVNCLESVEVSMYLEIYAYNLRSDGTRDYLSIGEDSLPALYFMFCLIFFLMFLLWVYVCLKNRGSITKIHILMGVLVVVKSFNLVCKAEDKLHIQSTGTGHGWDVAFYTSSVLKGIMLFTVIALIGAGWSILKPFVQRKERRLLMVVVPLQVMANIAMAVIIESSPSMKSLAVWKIMFLLLDLVCCFLVLLPIIWSTKSLREASHTDGKAAVSLLKLTLFRRYYMIVIAYIYLTRFIPSMFTDVVSYRHVWTIDLMKELASVIFYVFTGYSFRPEPRNPYIRIEDDEDDDAGGTALHEFET